MGGDLHLFADAVLLGYVVIAVHQEFLVPEVRIQVPHPADGLHGVVDVGGVIGRVDVLAEGVLQAALVVEAQHLVLQGLVDGLLAEAVEGLAVHQRGDALPGQSTLAGVDLLDAVGGGGVGGGLDLPDVLAGKQRPFGLPLQDLHHVEQPGDIVTGLTQVGLGDGVGGLLVGDGELAGGLAPAEEQTAVELPAFPADETLQAVLQGVVAQLVGDHAG